MKNWTIKVHRLFMHLRRNLVSSGVATWEYCLLCRLFLSSLSLIFPIVHSNIFQLTRTTDQSSQLPIGYYQLASYNQLVSIRERQGVLVHILASIMMVFWAVYLYGD